MDIICATSVEASTNSALDHVLDTLGAEQLRDADFIAVHLSETHDLALIGARLGGGQDRRIHAGTSCLGVMGNSGMVSHGGSGLGVFAIRDPKGDYGTGMSAFDGDPRRAARDAVIRALSAADRQGEAPDLIWLTTSPGTEEDVLRGIADVVGASVPVVGGSAADNHISGGWRVCDGAEIVADGVIVSVLFPSSRLSIAYQSGYAPTDVTGVVTRAEGRKLKEINDRPAAAVYSEWTGGRIQVPETDEAAMILSESTFTPLGRRSGMVADVPFYILSHPASVHADGSIDLFADISVGDELTLMQGGADSLTSRAGRVASFAASSGRIETGEIAGALVIYCGGCMLAVQDRMDEVASGIDAALGSAPFLGIFTFGEQGPILNGQNAHGNLMISCVTFAR
ncbi:MAG: FIST C-terminal domain-containing protein [Pseudomonadota bacterium]